MPPVGFGIEAMHSIARLVAIMLLAAPAGARSIQGKPVSVTAPAGTVEGRNDGEIHAFIGIPYAAAPIGPLRWRPPRPLGQWKGSRLATEFGADCPQVRLAEDLTPSDQPMKEDCLYLNIWRPEGAKGLPVMVWIHGGGFIMGSSASPVLDGTALARRGVLVVSFNYRVGRFGFFAHPALSAEAGGKPSANFAFLDMIAALSWVRDNVASFGGDPRNVTIFGESSGGAAINFLMAAPAARSLFHKAIVQSGANRDAFAKLTVDRPWRVSAEKAGVAFATHNGLANATTEQLRSLSADKVQGGLTFVDPQVERYSGPVIDGETVLDDPIALFSSGQMPAIPYLIGSNGHELSEEGYAQIIIQAIEKYSPSEAVAELKRAYGDPLEVAVIDDFLFGEGARGYARIMAKHGSSAWRYRFDHVAAAQRAARHKANHASEIAFLFGNLHAGADAADRAASERLGSYWTNFAKTGDPNGPGLPNWPRQSEGDPLLSFTLAGVEVEMNPNGKRLDAVERAQALRPR